MKDLSGDGKVTKKDVLIGRGVLDKSGKQAMMGGGMAKAGYKYGGKANKKGYMNGGCVMGNRGVRKTQMV
jgi:hypothetical protein